MIEVRLKLHLHLNVPIIISWLYSVCKDRRVWDLGRFLVWFPMLSCASLGFLKIFHYSSLFCHSLLLSLNNLLELVDIVIISSLLFLALLKSRVIELCNVLIILHHLFLDLEGCLSLSLTPCVHNRQIFELLNAKGSLVFWVLEQGLSSIVGVVFHRFFIACNRLSFLLLI
jgi:hypothetical protein